MLISLKSLIDKYNLKINGIIHVGASHAEEAESYLQCGIQKQFWIEAIPEIHSKAEQIVRNNKEAHVQLACVSDTDFEPVVFNITNNDGQSSSFLPLKEHKKYHPTVKVVRTLEMLTIKLDSIFEISAKTPQFSLPNYNFLNLDIQGAELKALKGFEKGLQNIDYIYCEVNDDELYEGCPHVAEIDAYLAKFGFVGVECKMTDCHWGDKFYIKK